MKTVSTWYFLSYRVNEGPLYCGRCNKNIDKLKHQSKHFKRCSKAGDRK